MKKSMKKRGFTLIELLGVIVILAIIGLIIIPTIFKIIKNVKKNSNKNSVQALIKAVKLNYFDADQSDDLLFTFGDYSEDGISSTNDYEKINLNDSNFIKFETTNNPLKSIDGLNSTENKKIIDLIDYNQYSESLYDSKDNFEKVKTEEIENDIQSLINEQLSKIDYLEEDSEEDNILITDDGIIQDNLSNKIKKTIKDELLVSGKTPNYGYLIFSNKNGFSIELKLVYDEFCYIKNKNEDKIIVSENLDDCGFIEIENEYSDNPTINFILDNDEVTSYQNDWYTQKLKIIMYATSSIEDKIKYINYCKTSEESCDPLINSNKVMGSKISIDLSDVGPTKYCAVAVTNSGVVGEVKCSEEYRVDIKRPFNGKMLISGEKKLLDSEWYTSDVNISVLENGNDNESGLYQTITSIEKIDISSFGTIANLITFDKAGNNNYASGKVKVDLDSPVIYGIENPIIIKEGTNADLDKGIMVVDAISGGLGYTTSMSETKNLTTGSYEITYTAYDRAGNSGNYIREIEILSAEEYEDYIDLISDDDVCIGDDCVCNSGNCVCLNDSCDQSDNNVNKDLQINDDYQVDFVPSASILKKQDNWINRAFDLSVRVTNNKGINIKNIYWCISTNDKLDANECNPLEYYDGSRKSPYRLGSKKLQKTVRVNMSKNIKISRAQKSGSTKVCVYAVGMDDTRSNVYCSDLYKIDIEKPNLPEFSVEGLKVTNVINSKGKERVYYKPGALLKVSSVAMDNLTETSLLKYTWTPKDMTFEQLTSDGYPIIKQTTPRVTVKDLAGNSVSSKSFTIYVDRTGPSYPSKEVYTLYSNKRKYSWSKSTEPLKVILKVNNNNYGAKVDHFEVSRDKITWETITSGYVMYNKGRYYFRAVDEFGQPGSITSYYANIVSEEEAKEDETLVAPIIDITPDGYSSNKQVTISYEDSYQKLFKVVGSKKTISNVDLIKCETDRNMNYVCDENNVILAGNTLEESVWYQTNTNPILTVYENYTNIVARVRDDDNHERSVTKQINSIDTNPTVPSITGGSQSWQKEANISILVPSNAVSGIAFYEYCVSDIDDSSNCNWIKLNEQSLLFKEQGEHYIFFRSESNTGLISDSSGSQFVRIDSDAPIVEVKNGEIANIHMIDNVSGLKSYCITKDDNSNNCTTATSEENISGQILAGKWYNISDFKEKQITFSSTENGVYYVFVKDKAENLSEPKSFKIVYAGITSKAYVPGELVSYAGLSWKVIADEGKSVSLILDGYYKSGVYGSTTNWDSSTAKSVVNTDFVNAYSGLKTEIENGGILYDSSSESYVRLPRVDEISSSISMSASYPFWTMTDDNSKIYISLNSGTLYRNVYDATKYEAYFSNYTYTDSENYKSNSQSEEFNLADSYIIKCAGTHKEIIAEYPKVTSIVTSSSCGNTETGYLSTDVNHTSTISSKPSFYYCDFENGSVKIAEDAQSKTVWTYATATTGTTPSCALRTYYNPVKTVKSIVYRPVITVKKLSSTIDIPKLADKIYTKGDKVDYANLKWQVVADNDTTVTLILNGNYKTGSYGATNLWSSSIAKNVITNDFVNENTNIKNAIDNGYIIYDDTSASYIRLPLKSEIDASLTSASKTPFWTMTTNGSSIYYSLYDGKFTTNSPSYSETSTYVDYDYYDSSDYLLSEAKQDLMVYYIYACNDKTTETLINPGTINISELGYIVSETCGLSRSDSYGSSNVYSSSQSSSGTVSFNYCDSDYGSIRYNDTGYGYSLRWAYASGSACVRHSRYNPIKEYSHIGYRPVITVRKG